ncbi:hypothetical protein ACFSHP_12395 [Novosphingobium panipatense]
MFSLGLSDGVDPLLTQVDSKSSALFQTAAVGFKPPGAATPGQPAIRYDDIAALTCGGKRALGDGIASA